MLKEGITVCRYSNLKQGTPMFQLSKNSMKLYKMTDPPKEPWLVTRAPHSTTLQVHGQNGRNNPSGKAIQTSLSWKELKEQQKREVGQKNVLAQKTQPVNLL